MASGGCVKPSPLGHGNEAPAGQQSPLDAISEQPNAGIATPRRLTQMTTAVVNRRSTGGNSHFRADPPGPVGWGIASNKSITGRIAYRLSSRSGRSIHPRPAPPGEFSSCVRPISFSKTGTPLPGGATGPASAPARRPVPLINPSPCASHGISVGAQFRRLTRPCGKPEPSDRNDRPG